MNIPIASRMLPHGVVYLPSLELTCGFPSMFGNSDSQAKWNRVALCARITFLSPADLLAKWRRYNEREIVDDLFPEGIYH